MNSKRRSTLMMTLALWALVLLAATASSAVAQQTTSCGTCRNPNDAQDRSYCDPATGQCVQQTAPCPPYFVDAQGNQNLCQPNYGRDPQTGQCLYRAKICNNPTGCFNSSCNPTTGNCELVTDDPRARFICGGNDNACSSQGCPRGECSYFACDPDAGTQNCATLVPNNCYATNPSACQVGVPINNEQDITEFSCQIGNGCVYTATVCAPPADPCQELVRDPNTTGCCTYRPRDCAAEFGNNPNYTYSCDPTATNGVCKATPKIGPPTDKEQCKNGGWQRFNYPRTFKNEGDCIQFVNTGK